MKFVFRNNTVERFFSKEYIFSGYDDVSIIPEICDCYVWWYQAPFRLDQHALSEELDGYVRKFLYVLQHMDKSKTFIAMTMDVLFNVTYTDDDYEFSKAVDEYNAALYEAERANCNVKVLDFREFSRQYPLSELIDWKYYFMYQMGMNPKLSQPFILWFERKLDSIALRRKKCLVLDLDNTLWGGVLGESGIDGVKIGGDYPGNAFLYWQNALLQLSQSGVILAICSKNNESDVLELWEKNPFVLLKKDAFSAYRINWMDKASNIRDLAKELNIGLDSIVFVDDNPAERELVHTMLPMVAVPDFPEKPYLFPVFVKQLVSDYFKVYAVTEEDRKKTEQYKANAERSRFQDSFTDYNMFLASLSIHISIEPANEFNILRIAQMTQKTNQFNLTTKRYTDADVRGFMESGWRIWCINVSDKYGDNGITGCMMVNGDDVDTLLLSCRILGKGIETAFVMKILELLRDEGVMNLTASYLPTSKNDQVKDFWEKCGFICTSTEDDGSKHYSIDLSHADLSISNIYHIEIQGNGRDSN